MPDNLYHKQQSINIIASILCPIIRSNGVVMVVSLSLQWEEDELREFELLEQAAAEISLLSKAPHTSTHHTLPTHHTLQWIPPPHYQSSTQQSVPIIQQEEKIETSLPFTVRMEEETPVDDSDNELDDTLRATPPPTTSLAAGIDFNDEESWDSFSKPSPERRPLNQSSDETQSSIENCEEVVKTISDHSDRELDRFVTSRESVETGSVATAPVLSDSFSMAIPQPLPQALASVPLLVNPIDKPIPPPSRLLSKLFPALRKETVKGPSPLSKAPSPVQSVDSDSGKESSLSSATSLLGEELRLKLAQLETEIERYRAENGRLETLRREREKVSASVSFI